MSSPQNADAFLLFGATGDLARKKIFPALYKLTLGGQTEISIIGIARRPWTDKELIERVRESIKEYAGDDVDKAALDNLCDRVSYISCNYTSTEDWQQVSTAVNDFKLPVSFLAIPPSLFDDVVEGLASIDITKEARVIIEKPFGRDLESAKELNKTLLRHLDESQIFRIDHFLGKEPVQNLMVFRFANSLLEPVWNRHHVGSVSITMTESFGLEGRGAFYDKVGAIRDVVQNHLLQVVSLLAMEPPSSSEPAATLDEKVKVFRAMKAIEEADIVRGQFSGYRDEDGVAKDSDTETFTAATLEVDSWRWAGVPFAIRTGKALKKTLTEAVIEFKQPPRMLFSEANDCPAPNRLVFRMKPDDEITLTMQAKVPGMKMVSKAVDLSVAYEEQLGDGPDAYERLIADALIGDERLFTRQDGVEEAWRVVEPILNPSKPAVEYKPGTWGPPEADKFGGIPQE